MNNVKNNELFDMDKTIANRIFENTTYPWEVLDKIKDTIKIIRRRTIFG